MQHNINSRVHAAAHLLRLSNQYGKDAPLAGPDFPAPSKLASSAPLKASIEKFETYLNDEASRLKTEDTAFAVSLFSSREKVTLYENYYTPPVDMGVKEVNRDSVFRVGSISKVVTVWAFLIAAGDEYFHDPVTKHVPELADLTAKRSGASEEPSVVYDDIETARWEDITLGQLASHGAGIARDLVWMDHARKSREELEELNLPKLDPTDIPSSSTDPETPNSIREDFFYYLARQHPHFPPAHSPVYSNIAYLLLSYALESITGQDLATIVERRIFEPLGMSHSSYETPIPGGVVPSDKDPASESVMWTAASHPSMDHPGGSNYMSTADLVRAGQAILQSTLLSPSRTRRWLKPTMFTGDPTSHVGAPWEIRCVRAPNNRIYEYYCKSGDIGAYDSVLVLSPQHEVGWVVQAAGSTGQAGRICKALMNAFQTFFVDAVEEQAMIEAGLRFDGVYVDEASNSSVKIVAGYEGHMGLAALGLIFRGKPFDSLRPVGLPEDLKAKTTLLYPSMLKTIRKKADGSGEYESRLGFRAIFWAFTEEGNLDDPSMAAWGTVGHVKYGERCLDDWVFELSEDGLAIALHLRALRVVLHKVVN